MNYIRYDEIMTKLVRGCCDSDHDFEIGVDISDIPSIKIIFDGYGETDDGEEDRDNESYAIFIHKNSGQPDFVFPQHDSVYNLLVHRPHEEVCIYAWYNVQDDCFDILTPSEDDMISEEELMSILEDIYTNYIVDKENQNEI